MSWFKVEPPKLFCETCKAHIESATYYGTVLEEGSSRYTGEGNGFYAVRRVAFCARCEPDHDIVIIPRHSFNHIHLDISRRRLVDQNSKAVAAQTTADAVIEALQAAQTARETDEAAKERVLDEAQAEADRARTAATEAAPTGEFRAQHLPPPTRDPIT